MANNCCNTMTISGETKDLHAFLDSLKFVENQTVYKDYEDKYYGFSTLSWKVAETFGGGKFRIYGSIIYPLNSPEDLTVSKCLRYSFDSAWDYPEGFAYEIVERHPKLSVYIISEESGNQCYSKVHASVDDEGEPFETIECAEEWYSYLFDNNEFFRYMYDKLVKTSFEDYPLMAVEFQESEYDEDGDNEGIETLAKWFRECLQAGCKDPLPKLTYFDDSLED